MYSYLKKLENRLNDDQKDILSHIYEPVVVATPLNDSRRDVMIMPDGEIRSYGKLYASRHMGQDGITAYLSSVDCGLTWQIKYSKGKMNACTYFEKADVYVTACDFHNNNDGITKGLYVYRSEIGPDDPNPEVIELSEDEMFHDTFLPKKSVYSDRIWFTSQRGSDPYFFYSDDYGKTWERRAIKNPHNFEIVFPHKGLRWCKGSGTEPNAVEIGENTLMMIIRTPMDCFYKSYSYDGGDTWTDPKPSEFYGTDTTAYLLTLSDGRVINFWNNTKPLDQPHLKAIPTSQNFVISGNGENAFTNRDAAHAAISDDGGKTFKGYREIILNPVRNNSDFRYTGGVKHSADKSVHQFQAFELPFNKVLVSAGQNIVSRRLIIFDIDWLYETTRKEDFLCGLGNVTTHTYLKSVSGSHYGEVGNGHCSWNRTYSAYPVPDSEGGFAEVLSVSKHHDDRLVNDIGGMCWNFPLAKKGRVSVKIKIAEKQARVILTDRWYNTCDPYAAAHSPFWFDLEKQDVGDGYANVDIDFDTEIGMASVSINDVFLCKVRMTNDCPTGLCYLIMQCATDGDSEGFYLKTLEKA